MTCVPSSISQLCSHFEPAVSLLCAHRAPLLPRSTHWSAQQGSHSHHKDRVLVEREPSNSVGGRFLSCTLDETGFCEVRRHDR